jgi:hypothetical protein
MENKDKIEYWYIDFKDAEIYSYYDEENELDQCNKQIGNNFTSYYNAKEFLKVVLDKQKID